MLDLNKYSNEPEFQAALKEMFSSLDASVINNPRYASILDKIVEPDRIIKFDVNWVDDNGVTRTNKGYRVQFNNVNGVYKGVKQSVDNDNVTIDMGAFENGMYLVNIITKNGNVVKVVNVLR